MYPTRLDTPPPASNFRRPWSPDPYDPLPSVLNSRTQLDTQHDYPYEYPQHARREASDVSIEALDLADYAMTLRPNRHADPQLRPLASLDSLQPPSLVSRVETLSSNTSSRASHRPFSLPTPARYNARYASDFNLNRPSNHPYLSPSPRSQDIDPEIDISQFPAWSRNWYEPKPKPPPSPDIYTPVPTSYLDSGVHRSLFDPGLDHKNFGLQSDLGRDTTYSPSHGHDSTRDLLPWSTEPPSYGSPIDASLKEERMRMLEQEFGPNAKGKEPRDTDEPMIGSVDGKGRLITDGPKKRIAARVVQILLSLAAAIPSIYAALVIKPNPAPPPQSKPAAFVLYVVSVLTFLVLLFLFVFRPCCTSRDKRSARAPMAGGMMVLPVQGLNNGKKKHRNGKGRKGKGGGPGDVQVNLIVDPSVFGGRRGEESEEEEEEYIPGAFDSRMPGKKNTRRRRRKGVFEGLALEEEWKRARSWARKLAVFDVGGVLVWGAVFVVILLGKRCPSGGYDGWCNAYNVSSAAACLLCVAFGFSTFFDIKDLHASKASPRTRT